MTPIDKLKAVLCDPEGKCCIHGSDEDRRIVDEAITALQSIIAQHALDKMAENARALGLDYEPAPVQPVAHTYSSTQATMCACCGEHKHTPLRIDKMGGYVCLTCIDKKLGSLLGEFGYSPAQPAPVQPVALRDALADILGGVYVCDRAWSAWGVGTMTQDDFYPAAESDEVLDSLVEAIAKATPPAAQPAVPEGMKLVPLELLERAAESLGSFVSDHGWSQSDMDTFDELSLLTDAPEKGN
jgi:hypothetical protein